MARLWLIGCVLLSLPPVAGKTVIEWVFDQPNDLRGWQPNGALADVVVKDGALVARTTDWDPYFTSPTFEIAARPWQVVELTVRSDRGGEGELYYTNTLDTPYQGFTPGKSAKLRFAPGGDWQVLRVRPFWQAEPKIIKLRLDLFQNQTVAIRSIRVVEPDVETVSRATAWDFTGGLGDWSVDGLGATPGAAGLALRVTEQGGLLRSPSLQVDLGDRPWVALRARSSQLGSLELVYATARSSGLQSVPLRLRADGRWHTYNIDAGSQTAWDGELLAVGLRPVGAAGGQLEVASVQLLEDAIGDPDLEVRYVGLGTALARVGKPVPVVVQVVNHGATTAPGVTASLSLPAGVRVTQPGQPLDLGFQVPGTYRFVVQAERPVSGELGVTLQGPGAPPQPARGNLQVTAGPRVPPADYVPPPQPVKTKYRVGSYYFPGWATAARWEPIDRVAPQRRPVLGYYDEANPECIDWQIKWAVEHGISFFLVDWYWSQGGMSLRHWVDNLAKARYRDQIQWAVMWANHNAPNTHSEADWRAVTQYWIDHYLKLPNYLRVGGQPVVYIWAPSNIRRDLGGVANSAKLYAMSQEMAKAAGLPGIRFIATGGGAAVQSVDESQALASEGYYGRTSYHWWGDAPQRATDWRRFPFSLVVDRSRPAWDDAVKVSEAGGLKFQPVVDTGWDDEPWNNHLAITGRTPELFEKLLRDAKDWLDSRREDFLVLGPWNEWGEGSYIEPNQEYGFGMLEAVRNVFAEKGNWPAAVAPVDVGLGPYDLSLEPARAVTAWEFDNGTQGWGPMMGLATCEARDGALYLKTSHRDPAVHSPTLNVPARNYRYVHLRLKATRAQPGTDGLQLFFATATRSQSEPNSVKAEFRVDGQYQVITLDLGANKRWNGTARQFRLDPGSSPDTEVWIDWFRLSNSPTPAG
ncbi:MAG: glycoside hydrolase family 99-like domain-containing protein [Fimbriimonadaceae bacterium]|nr:glycoside hydrolase family 99-like domain-containing protein [Fimbriimonadaceae bacterium]